MRISFEGFDSIIELPKKGAVILCIKNKSLFARICESLITLKGENAIEPYSVWDDDGVEIRPSNAFIAIPNVFDLPWKHKSLTGVLYSRLEKDLMIDETLRREFQDINTAFECALHKLDFQFNANYAFGAEWTLSGYLKSLSYGIDYSDDISLFDKLISFIDFGADMAIDKTLVFVNLKAFLTENELISFQERLFFHGISALLLENQYSEIYTDFEKEYMVDQDFIEYIIEKKSDCPSSLQGRICSNGFGAVAF